MQNDPAPRRSGRRRKRKVPYDPHASVPVPNLPAKDLAPEPAEHNPDHEEDRPDDPVAVHEPAKSHPDREQEIPVDLPAAAPAEQNPPDAQPAEENSRATADDHPSHLARHCARRRGWAQRGRPLGTP